MSEQNTCGKCEYYDQHKEGMFCKNQHNMLAAHGEIRILDTTKACDKFEPRLPENHNARLLFLAERHADDLLVKAVVSRIKINITQLQNALQQSEGMITRLDNMANMKPNYIFGGMLYSSFECFSEIQATYKMINEWFYTLAGQLEILGEDVSFY
jgi:hypothetical protein